MRHPVIGLAATALAGLFWANCGGSEFTGTGAAGSASVDGGLGGTGGSGASSGSGGTGASAGSGGSGETGGTGAAAGAGGTGGTGGTGATGGSGATGGAGGTGGSGATGGAGGAGGTGGTAPCTLPMAECDNDPATVCETNTDTSLNNCGACSHACAPVYQAQPSCTGGTCVPVCNGGYADCDGVYGNGCEARLSSDIANCGHCGTVCQAQANQTATCASGSCGAVCNQGWADCNGGTDGCETRVFTDPNNCGTCGHECNFPPNTNSSCQNGSCVLDKTCKTGFADCNGDMTDGCETDLNNTTSCGFCGHNCLGSACHGGVCDPTVIASFQGSPWSVVVDATNVYWVNKGLETQNTGSVMMRPKDLTSGLSYVSQTNEAQPMWLAQDGEFLYWTATDAVRRVKTDGTALGDFASSPGRNVGIATDGTYCFWTGGNSTKSWVRRQLLISSNPTPAETILSSGQSKTQGVAVDATTGVVFWAADNNIVKASNPTGTNWTVVTLASNQSAPESVSLLGANVYWTNSGTAPLLPIRKTSAAGGGSVLDVTGPASSHMMAIRDDVLYWTEGVTGQTTGRVMRVPVNVSGAVPVALAVNQAFPHGIAVDDTYVYWTTLDGNTVARVAR